MDQQKRNQSAVPPGAVAAAIRVPNVDGLRSFILGLPEHWSMAEMNRLFASDQTTIFRAINTCVDIQQQQQAREAAAKRMNYPNGGQIIGERVSSITPTPTIRTTTTTTKEYDVASVLLQNVMLETEDSCRRQELWEEQVAKFNFGCIAIQTCPNAWKNYFYCMKRSATLQQQQQQQQFKSNNDASSSSSSSTRHSDALMAITASCETEKRAMEMCVGRAVVSAVQVAASSGSSAEQQ